MHLPTSVTISLCWIDHFFNSFWSENFLDYGWIHFPLLSLGSFSIVLWRIGKQVYFSLSSELVRLFMPGDFTLVCAYLIACLPWDTLVGLILPLVHYHTVYAHIIMPFPACFGLYCAISSPAHHHKMWVPCITSELLWIVLHVGLWLFMHTSLCPSPFGEQLIYFGLYCAVSTSVPVPISLPDGLCILYILHIFSVVVDCLSSTCIYVPDLAHHYEKAMFVLSILCSKSYGQQFRRSAHLLSEDSSYDHSPSLK